MCGLDHVCSMDVVVISHVSMVMILQCHYEGNEGVHRNLKGLQQVTLLKSREKSLIHSFITPSLEMWLVLCLSAVMLRGAT